MEDAELTRYLITTLVGILISMGGYIHKREIDENKRLREKLEEYEGVTPELVELINEYLDSKDEDKPAPRVRTRRRVRR